MSKKVMIVDDSMMVRTQVGRALTQAGFVVVEAKDGQDALEKLATETDIAMVVSDVNMPRMSGLELLEAMRKDPRFTALPVVMLTTEGQPELVNKAKSLGAKGWIVKPFKPELIIAAAKKITAQAA